MFLSFSNIVYQHYISLYVNYKYTIKLLLLSDKLQVKKILDKFKE